MDMICADCRLYGDGVTNVRDDMMCYEMHCSQGRAVGFNNPVRYWKTKPTRICECPDEFVPREA
jgi:hypothetical protein